MAGSVQHMPHHDHDGNVRVSIVLNSASLWRWCVLTKYGNMRVAIYKQVQLRDHSASWWWWCVVTSYGNMRVAIYNQVRFREHSGNSQGTFSITMVVVRSY